MNKDQELQNWKDRMFQKRETEEKENTERAERERQAYLRRTGREEMKP